MSSSIKVDLAIAGNVVLDDTDEHIFVLHEPVEKQTERRHVERETSTLRIVFVVMICALFLEGLSPRKQFGGVTTSGRRAIPDSGKIRFAFRSKWGRTFGRLGPAEKKSPKTCAIFAKRFQGNEVTDRNVD